MNKVKAFIASYSITTHSLAVAVATLVTLYAAVPQFSSLVNALYAATPSWFHQVFAAAFGIWAFYHGASNASSDKPSNVVGIGAQNTAQKQQ